jgi:hypothetical protein
MDNFQKELRKTAEDKRKTKSEAVKLAWASPGCASSFDGTRSIGRWNGLQTPGDFHY